MDDENMNVGQDRRVPGEPNTPTAGAPTQQQSAEAARGSGSRSVAPWIIGALVLAALAAGAWYMFAGGGTSLLGGDNMQQQDPNEVVATVNGEDVTRDDMQALQVQAAAAQGVDLESIDAATQEQLDQQALDALIAQVLLQQQVDTAGITVTEAEISAEIEEVSGQFESTQEYEAALEQQGLSEAELRAQIEQELATQSYLNSEIGLDSITATEAEIEEAYGEIDVSEEGDEVPALEEVSGQIEAFVIQQKQQQEINAFIEELRAGADIEVLI